MRRTIPPTYICFNCNEQGHWYKDCPSMTPTRSQPSSPATATAVDSYDLPVIQCPCGGGICNILTSRTVKNPDRKFYSCPRKPQETKCGFFKWYDTVSSPQSTVPVCSCGAGRCSVLTETAGPNAGRRYFACRVPKGEGACPFFQWEDGELDSTMNEDLAESKIGSSSSTGNGCEVNQTVNADLGKGKRANSSQSKKNKREVSHKYVDSGRCEHANVLQSKGNDFEVSQTGNADSGDGKRANIPESAKNCEVPQSVYVGSGRGKRVNSKRNGCDAIHTVNIDLGNDKHANTPQYAGGECEVVRSANIELGEDIHLNKPQSGGSKGEVTHTVNVNVGKDDQATAPQSGGSKGEVTHTVNVNVGKDDHASTPQSTENCCEVNHLDECKNGDSPQPAENICELSHSGKVDLGRKNGLGFERSKRMRSDLSMVSYHLHFPYHNMVFEHFKRMRVDVSMMGNQQPTPELVFVHIPPAEVKLPPTESSRQNMPSVTPTENNIDLQFVISKNNISLDFAVADIVQDTDSCISTANKTSQGSRPSETGIFHQKFELSGHSSVNRDTVTGDLIFVIHKIFGVLAMGWLGRLVFLPRRGITVPPPKPFFCGVFPSFCAIVVPEHHKPLDASSSAILPRSRHTKYTKLYVNTPGRDAQFRSDHIDDEPSVEQQTVRSFRSNLLSLLKSMDPRDHKYMERVANPILEALDHLSADNNRFRERVKEFIHCASALAQTEPPYSEDLIHQYNQEKTRFSDATRDHSEAIDALKASKDAHSLLHKEATRLKKMLIQIEKKLSCSEMEISKLKTRVDETSKVKTEHERSLRNIEKTLQLRVEREKEHHVAKEAFDKARNRLLL